jgi:cytochrome c biogenesis protein CcmG, thiol:disulfide interchange protein DsbE
MRFVLPLLLFVAIAALLFAGMGRDGSEVPSPFLGNTLPAFDLPDLHDPARRFDTQRLDEYHGVKLLNVWASWCPPCRQEHPVFMDIADQIPIYGINYKDVRAEALDWLARLGDPYVAIGHDEAGLAGIDLGVYGVPETYVLDSQGRLRHKYVGPVTRAVYKERLLPVIEQLRREEAQP